MKFKFETGTVIEITDERIIDIIRKDKRYTEVKEVASKVSEEITVEKPKTARKGGK